MESTIITIVGGAISGGVLVKVLDYFFLSKKSAATLNHQVAGRLREEEQAFRQTLWTEIGTLRQRLEHLEKENESLKEKYLKQLMLNAELQIKVGKSEAGIINLSPLNPNA